MKKESDLLIAMNKQMSDTGPIWEIDYDDALMTVMDIDEDGVVYNRFPGWRERCFRSSLVFTRLNKKKAVIYKNRYGAKGLVKTKDLNKYIKQVKKANQ